MLKGAKIALFAGHMKEITNDLRKLKPTVFVSFPYFFYDVYHESLKNYWGNLCCRKSKKIFGGRVRVIGKTYGDLDEQIKDFYMDSEGDCSGMIDIYG
jgi:hypothetical protein